jgi:crotonobetainyl-CoA:carnitine CoA-transferase CaiB-like acyl-CoA transferase
MADRLLSGFRALDLTDEKGFICGKVLAALGVDVIKVERPGGDPSRKIPPFINNIEDPEKSLYWMAFNTDKRGITLNIETDQGKFLLRKLIEEADFVLETFTPGYLESLGLGYEALNRINQRVILTSITPFGQKGPYSRYKGSELIASAMGGMMDTNGEPDRAPIKEGPDSIYYQSGVAAACGTVIAHYYRETTGEGQHVDVSLQEVTANRSGINLLLWQWDKRLLKRNGPIRKAGARITRQFWPCKDGYIMWMLSGARWGAPSNRALSKWLNEEGIENTFSNVKNWEDFDMASVSQDTIEACQSIIGTQLFKKYTKKEIAEESLKRGVDLVIVNSPSDVLESPQLKERDYWAALKNPETEFSFKYPKHLFLSNETASYTRFAAPLIGQHNTEIYSNELGLSDADIASLKDNNII